MLVHSAVNESASTLLLIHTHAPGRLPREHVTIKQIDRKGAFGQVAKATIVNLLGSAKKTLVAVKMLKGTKK